MIQEIVTSLDELAKLSTGTIRYMIVAKPVYYADMAGRNKMMSAERDISLKFSAISIASDPQRLIIFYVPVGLVNRYEENFDEKLEQLREKALAIAQEITDRTITEGAFE